MIPPGCTPKYQPIDFCINKLFKATLWKYWVCVSNYKEHIQLPPPSRQNTADWEEKAFNYISNDTQMVSRSFDACGITTIDSSKVQSRSFYKSCMENASKHLENDEEVNLFILWFYTVISLGSLKRKKNKNLKYCLLIFEWLKICNPHYRVWSYLEKSGISCQLDRKSKTWFFTFLNVWISWVERDKSLISQFSPPKLKYFEDQNRPKGGPHENEFGQFPNAEIRFLNRRKKWGQLSGFHVFFLRYGP